MFLMRYPGGLAKVLTLSYDDGVEQDIELVRILDEHGIKCTFNLNTGEYAPEGHVWPEGQVHRRMTRKQCIELFKDSGHEVAVHGLIHELVTEAPAAMIVSEVMEDRKNLERDFGGMVRGMAYPFGPCNQTAVDALRSCGILYARTVTTSLRMDVPENWLRLAPTCHHDNEHLMELVDRLVSRKESDIYGCMLFYLWGHSYEFERDDNWYIIRDFCARAGGHEDIWYATNGEIFTYIEAWRRLISSADGNQVYNPTVTTLWYKDRRGIHSIAPGETVRLYRL